MLAQKLGRSANSAQEPASSQTNAQMYQINELTADFYHQNLLLRNNAVIRNYLTHRGIKPETAKRLKLGSPRKPG